MDYALINGLPKCLNSECLPLNVKLIQADGELLLELLRCSQGDTEGEQWFQVTHQQSGFGQQNRVGLVPDPSNLPTCCFMAGQTRTRTRQPSGFASIG